MTLEEAIEIVTEWLREDYEQPVFSPILAVLETREELMQDAGLMSLGDDEANTAHEMLLAASREDLVIALEGVLAD